MAFAAVKSTPVSMDLRLLCINQDSADLPRITGLLTADGYCIALDTMSSTSGLLRWIEQNPCDLILCDYRPNDDADLDALEIVKASGKDIPFIVLSNSLEDEVAFEYMKRGATDYVLRLPRLPAAIELAFRAKKARDEQKTSEVAILRREEQYRMLFAGNPNPMWVFDEESLAILAVNDAAVKHYGYSQEEFLAMSMRDLRPPEEIARLLATLAAHQTMPMGSAGVFKHLRKNGELIEVEVASSPIVFLGRPARLGLINDVTEKNSIQAQFLQSQKMESLGRLAGGVAHDLNNLMGVVLGYGELALDHIDRSSVLYRKVEGMQKAADRAVGIVRQLLAFSRKQILRPRMLSLNAVIKDMEELLQRLIGENIELCFAIDPNLGTVKADAGQMEQVIMNLVVNARDAMTDGGRLTISTANVDLDESDPRHERDLRAGAHVMLAVSDTGSGMDAATQSRIFEPFFTTKDLGKGTGLGLATVYGIVKQSWGSITVHSELGHGATFRVYLPRVQATPLPLCAVQPVELAALGTETILLVEDAEPLREVARQFLEQAGYTVLIAENGLEALAAADLHVGRIDLLLTDVVMPGLSGPQVARQLSLSHPDLHVLYMSGYTDEALAPHGVLDEAIALLEKPFTRGSLLRKLREILDLKPGRAETENDDSRS